MNNTDHLIKSYDDELARLTAEIVRMGGIAITQLKAAMDAVEQRDKRAGMRVVGNDDTLDAMEHTINHDVVRLLALRAPMARDLREVFAALRIASDIERIGDYAANIARRAVSLSVTDPVTPARGLRHLSDRAVTAAQNVLAAYQDNDAERARQVWIDDDELDQAYTGVFRELLKHMMEDPRSIAACTHFLFIAKHIERIGDHATNIAEDIWFAVKGEHLKEKSQR